MKGVKLDTRIPILLMPNDVEHFNNPVYIMAADGDIYFPGEKVEARSKQLFKNLKEVYLLKGSKHMPFSRFFPEVQRKIEEWLKG